MYQKIVLVGRLGRDPEMRYLPSGQAVTSFSVATDNRYTSADGQQVNETTWFRVTVWGKQAENCNQYLKKGRLVLVEGRIKPDPSTGGPRIWNRQDGTPGASFEVTAQSVKFLSRIGDDDTTGAADFDETLPGSSEDDIPF